MRTHQTPTGEPPTDGSRQRSDTGWLRRFVAWFLRHLYTDLAWGYDLVASLTSMGQWWTWQRAIDSALPDGRLLEIGFGSGRLLQRLTRGGRTVIGIDISPQMAAITRRRLRRTGLPVHISRASALALPFADLSFAGAYATFPSDFILEPAALREVLRVMETGADFVVVPMARIRGQGPLDQLAGWLYRITGQSGPLPDDWERPFKSLNAEVRLETVEQERAQVVRLVITKSESRPDRIRSQRGE